MRESLSGSQLSGEAARLAAVQTAAVMENIGRMASLMEFLSREPEGLTAAEEQDAFLQVFWQNLEAAAASLTFSDDVQVAWAASQFFSVRDWHHGSRPLGQALVDFGRAYDLKNVEFRGHAILADYAYSIADGDEFRRHAADALDCAAIALDPARSSVESLAEHSALSLEEARREKEKRDRLLSKYGGQTELATADTQTANHTLDLLPPILRKVGRLRALDLVGRFEQRISGYELSGEMAYRLAVVSAEIGANGFAQKMARRGEAGFRALIEMYRRNSERNRQSAASPRVQEALARADAAMAHVLTKTLGERQAFGDLVQSLLLAGQGKATWDDLAQAVLDLENARVGYMLAEAESPSTDSTYVNESFARGKRQMREIEERIVRDYGSLRTGFALRIAEDELIRHARAVESALRTKALDPIPFIAELERSGRLDLAIGLYAGVLRKLESRREGTDVQDRIAYFETLEAKTVYQGLLRSLVLRGHPGDSERALAVSELSRSRQLKDLLGTRRVAALEAPERLAEELRSKLGSGEAVLAYHVLPEHLVAIVATSDSTRAELVEVEGEGFRAEVSALHAALADPASEGLDGRLSSLASVVLRPLEELDTVPDRLHVLGDGILNTVPIGALPGPDGRPLLEDCRVSYLPGVEWLLRTDAGPSAPRPTRLFAMADPIYSAPVPALPETREEVLGIQGRFGAEDSVLLGSEARESLIKSTNLRPFSHLHFATHGVLPGELPGVFEPALVLSSESGEDAFLTASEAEQLELDADVCVLSACNTGAGEVLEGEGVMGLSRAFLVAGAEAVVVSLWPVASDVTRDIMTAMYREMDEGKPVDEALRIAQLEVSRGERSNVIARRGLEVQGGASVSSVTADASHPFFWAPFIVLGGAAADARP